jgi:hypothetical protein
MNIVLKNKQHEHKESVTDQNILRNELNIRIFALIEQF